MKILKFPAKLIKWSPKKKFRITFLPHRAFELLDFEYELIGKQRVSIFSNITKNKKSSYGYKIDMAILWIWLRLFCSYYKMWTSRQIRRLGCTVTASLIYLAQPYKTKVVPFGLLLYNPDVVVSFVGVQEYHLTSCQNPLGG